jgi:hypothetical protein
VFAVLPFIKFCEIAKITFAVRARVVCRQFFCPPHLEDFVNVVMVIGTDMTRTSFEVVIHSLCSPPCFDFWQIHDCVTQTDTYPTSNAWSWQKFRQKITGHVQANTNEELPLTILRHTKFRSVFLTRDNSVTDSQFASFRLNASEVFASARATDTENIFHDEDFGLKVFNKGKEAPIKLPAGVFDHARSVICSISLPGLGEALARGTSNNYINFALAN